MKSTLLSLAFCFSLVSSAWSQTTLLNGKSLAYRSTGNSSSNAWILDRDGYVGTYITLAAPGNVTVSVKAEGTASGGVNPNMNVVIADTKTGFSVKPGAGTYNGTYALPAGTFFVRTEMTNDLALTSRQLKINSISITGAKVSNSATSANALAASDSYIANYRKGNATVDLSGLGLAAGTPIDVKLKRIGFNFGTAIPSYVEDYLGADGTAQQANYQARLNQNFNAVVPENAGKWSDTEGDRGAVTMEATDMVLDYAQSHGMYARMHNVIWDEGAGQPYWVNQLRTSASRGRTTTASKNDLRNAISSRIDYYVPGHADKYGEIDVYNESYQGQALNGRESYWSIYGTDGIAGIYNEVKQTLAASGATSKIYVNEFDALLGNSTGFFQNIETLRQAGIKNGYGEIIDGIGTEHYPSGLSVHKPSDIISKLQNYAVTGLPQTLTEFGIGAGTSATNAATMLSETMRLEFGNPSGTGFFMWGFQSEDGGGNLFAPAAALYTVKTSNWNNWTLTAAGKKWQDLLGIQDWDGNVNNGWTTQLTATTASDGTISFNGYYGDYVLTIGGNTYALSLVKGTSRYTLTPLLNESFGLLSASSLRAAPEPSSFALLLVCGSFASLRFRRRNST